VAEDSALDLAAWRERGDDRFDPVRFRFIEAMARRAAAHDGEARRLLDDRLVLLLAAYGEAMEKARAADAPAEDASPSNAALAELVAHIARHAPPPGEGLAAHAPAPDLKAVTYFRSTWSKLSAERRLNQSLAKMPDNAGPLNSHHLVHRALILMRDLSPEYLNRFMSYVDALLWIDQANASMAAAAASAPRAENNKTTRKTGRSKAA
jgi:hypothetical protein